MVGTIFKVVIPVLAVVAAEHANILAAALLPVLDQLDGGVLDAEATAEAGRLLQHTHPVCARCQIEVDCQQGDSWFQSPNMQVVRLCDSCHLQTTLLLAQA